MQIVINWLSSSTRKVVFALSPVALGKTPKRNQRMKTLKEMPGGTLALTILVRPSLRCKRDAVRAEVEPREPVR